jgi:diacylglycerol kinase (ATP)
MLPTNSAGDVPDHTVDSEDYAELLANQNGKLTVGLLINPNSRRNKAHLGEIINLVESCRQMHYCITDEPRDVLDGLSFLAGKSVDLLAISGGDGTVSNVFTHLLRDRPFESLPPIVILPGGTANMTGGDVGLKGSLPAALNRLRDWLELKTGQAMLQRRPILRVQPDSTQTARYGMFFGAGAIVDGINYTNQNIHSKGLKDEFSLGLGLVRTMWGIARQDPRFFQPTSMAIGVDGNPPDPKFSLTLVLVSSLERLFLNMHPYWGEPNGKPLHVSVIGNPANRLLRTLPALLRGKPSRYLTPENGYLSYNVETISLRFDGPFTLDGEIMHTSSERGPLKISNGGELAFLRI